MTRRRYSRPTLSIGLGLGVLTALGGCGSPTRYDPGPPEVPTGLATTPGDGQITLAWQPANKADAYNVYYSVSSPVSPSSATKIAGVTGTSTVVTGLTNDTTIHFVVTSINSNGESAFSPEVSAAPTAPGPFSPADLQGTWDLVALAAGPDAGWMRGQLTVDASGATTVASFLDSEGGVAPPAGLFAELHLNPTGQVRNTANSIDQTFSGDLESVNGRRVLVGTTASLAGATWLSVLAKRDPTITFVDGDLKGFGNQAGGARRFTFNQLTTGADPPAWEFATGQVGQDFTVQYPSVDLLPAGTNPAMPGKKATTLSIAADGSVTEVITPAFTGVEPAFLFDHLHLSWDKSVMIGVSTATGTTGSSRRFALRIYEMVNILSSDTHAFTSGDLAGTYRFRQLTVGASPAAASGGLTVDATGAATFSSYTASTGASAPAGFHLAIVTTATNANTDAAQAGQLSSPDDPSLHGKLSYFADLIVFTQTSSSGAYTLTVAVK